MLPDNYVTHSVLEHVLFMNYRWYNPFIIIIILQTFETCRSGIKASISNDYYFPKNLDLISFVHTKQITIIIFSFDWSMKISNCGAQKQFLFTYCCDMILPFGHILPNILIQCNIRCGNSIIWTIPDVSFDGIMCKIWLIWLFTVICCLIYSSANTTFLSKQNCPLNCYRCSYNSIFYE